VIRAFRGEGTRGAVELRSRAEAHPYRAFGIPLVGTRSHER